MIDVVEKLWTRSLEMPSPPALLDAGATRVVWRDNLGRQIIPGVEACHKGAIPLASVSGALLIDCHNREVFE